MFEISNQSNDRRNKRDSDEIGRVQGGMAVDYKRDSNRAEGVKLSLFTDHMILFLKHLIKIPPKNS
jgi:hypothetical protein